MTTRTQFPTIDLTKLDGSQAIEKTTQVLRDGAYVAIGLGVLGVQQLAHIMQTLADKAKADAEKAQAQVKTATEKAQAQVKAVTHTAQTQTKAATTKAQARTKSAATKAKTAAGAATKQAKGTVRSAA